MRKHVYTPIVLVCTLSTHPWGMSELASRKVFV